MGFELEWQQGSAADGHKTTRPVLPIPTGAINPSKPDRPASSLLCAGAVGHHHWRGFWRLPGRGWHLGE